MGKSAGMDPRARPLAETLRLNTRLFLNCLHGVDDESGKIRVSDRTNHLTFIAVHVVDARDYLLGALGGEKLDPFASFGLDAVSGIEEMTALPRLQQVADAWGEVTRRLLDRLEAVEAAQWDTEAPARFPIEDTTTLGMLAFLTQHDSYHLGQLAFLRKHMGFGAMSYSEPEDQ
jgi:uncharacterized damage-inducible protein DinB